MKESLHGYALDEVKSSVKSWATKQAPECFQTGFDAWVQRWRKCIERHEDYVEQCHVKDSSGHKLFNFVLIG